jgi:hypothetical protein
VKVGAKVGMATKTIDIIKVFGRFKAEVRSSGKSWTLKEAGLIVKVFREFEVKAGYVIAAGAGVFSKRKVWVKGFADAYYKSVTCYKDKGVVACYKGEEGVRKRKEVVASPVRVGLRRSRRNIVIILVLKSAFASLSFVQICCSSS